MTDIDGDDNHVRLRVRKYFFTSLSADRGNIATEGDSKPRYVLLLSNDIHDSSYCMHIHFTGLLPPYLNNNCLADLFMWPGDRMNHF